MMDNIKDQGYEQGVNHTHFTDYFQELSIPKEFK